jgi:hypothetical protein
VAEHERRLRLQQQQAQLGLAPPSPVTPTTPSPTTTSGTGTPTTPGAERKPRTGTGMAYRKSSMPVLSSSTLNTPRMIPQRTATPVSYAQPIAL